MADYKESFEGCTIEIKDDIKLSINGKEIDYSMMRQKISFLRNICPIPNMIRCWSWQEQSLSTLSNFPM